MGRWQEALRRAAVLWVGVPGQPARLVWPAWHDGAVHLLVGTPGTGSGEQEVPGLEAAERVAVTLAEPGGRAVLAVLAASVLAVPVGSAEWAAAVPVLLARRLNRGEEAATAARWATTCRLYRLEVAEGA